jgi:hypothetical protein
MLRNSPTSIIKLQPDADLAVYQFFLARLGPMAMLNANASDHTSGYQLYLDLRRQCAQINDNLQQTALNNLYALVWRDFEPATLFINRFRQHLSKAMNLGLKFDDKDRVKLFMTIAQRLPITSIYHSRIESIRFDNNKSKLSGITTLTLDDIETELFALDEETTNPISATCPQSNNATAYYASRPPRPPTRPPTNSNIICHNCGKPGHISPDCRLRLRPTGSQTPSRNSNQQSFRGYPIKNPPTNPAQRPRSFQQRNQQSNNSPTQNTSNNTSRRCFNCGDPNHMSNVCPHPKRQYNPRSNPRAMYTSNNRNQNPT